MVSAHVLRVFPTFGQCRRRAPGRRRQPPVAGVARQWKRRAVLGIEPRTSRTLSENHTTRPSSHLVSSPYSTSGIVTDVPFHAWRAALHASCQEAWPLHCGASLRHGSRKTIWRPKKRCRRLAPFVERRNNGKATPRGFEPLRAEPNGFRAHLL